MPLRARDFVSFWQRVSLAGRARAPRASFSFHPHNHLRAPALARMKHHRIPRPGLPGGPATAMRLALEAEFPAARPGPCQKDPCRACHHCQRRNSLPIHAPNITPGRLRANSFWPPPIPPHCWLMKAGCEAGDSGERPKGRRRRGFCLAPEVGLVSYIPTVGL